MWTVYREESLSLDSHLPIFIKEDFQAMNIEFGILRCYSLSAVIASVASTSEGFLRETFYS